MSERPRVGIVTLQDVPNYGAALQTFALKTTLGQFAQADVVNYHNRSVSRDMELIRSARSPRQLLGTAKDLFRVLPRRRVLRRFRQFQHNALGLGPRISANELAARGDDGRNAYVCGSDQIWNPTCVGAQGKIDPTYFLDFARKARKISYAASIGHYSFDRTEQVEVGRLLNDFHAISVRETNAVDAIQPLVGRPVHHVLDPTLLIDRKGWDELLPKSAEIRPEIMDEPYILVYSVPKSPLIPPAATHFSRLLGLRIVCIEQDPFFKVPSATVVNDAGPLEFLTLWSKAAFVITDSFHGTCFSILLNKPFTALSPGKHSGRILSLLVKTDLMGRYAEDAAAIAAVPTDVDFLHANQVLEEERQSSIAFLRSAILD